MMAYCIDDNWVKKLKTLIKGDIGVVADNVKALEYAINNSNLLHYSGDTINNTNSIVGDIRNIVIEGKTRYKKADGTYTDTWESGVTLESVGEKEKNSDGKYPIGLASGGGKNLIQGSVFTKSNKLTFTAPKDDSFFIPNLKVDLIGNKKYTFSMMTDGQYGSANGTDTIQVFLLKDGEYSYFFELVLEANNTKVFTPTQTGNYSIRLDVNKKDCTHSFWNLQIEKGEKATSYEPYKEDKRNILLNSPLRAIGDTKDYIDFYNSKVVRKCGVRVYQSGDESDTTVITDKTNTIYQLATPVEESIEISPTDNPITSYKDSCTLATTNTLKGNIQADMPTNVSAIITQQASQIAQLSDDLLQTQSALIEAEYENLG